MSAFAKALVGLGVVALFSAAAFLSISQRRDRGAEVSVDVVEKRPLFAVVTASGNIRPRRTVDISSDVSARVTSVEVEEGDDVEEGQVLLRLDPSQYEAIRSRAQAALRQATAQAANQQASLTQAERAYDRLLTIYVRDSTLVSMQQLEDAETAFQVAQANLEAANFAVEEAQASLEETEDQLSNTIITAPMSGRVTRLNVEVGETVMIGTMNNPGSLILTISDLSTMEVVVQVDETDVPLLEVGDSANVRIDAFPDRTFVGRVSEIGNSAIVAPSGNTQSAIDFEVVITLAKASTALRPDLSATAEIVTETRAEAVTVPIIALTIREIDGDEIRGLPGPSAGAAGPAENEVEGVFVVRGRSAHFTPVTVGVTGADHFEVLDGVTVGDTVVAGPYQVVRQLRDGDPIRFIEDGDGRDAGAAPR